MDYIQIWHVVVTGIQGVSHFKVTLNSYVWKNYAEFWLFIFPEVAEDNFKYLHVYVTGHR